MYEKSKNLFDCHIAGFNYYDGLDVIDALKLGTKLTLKAEPDNPFDADAVVIYYGETKLGYVPRTKNNMVSDLLYFGHGDIIEAKINSHNPQAHTDNQFRIVVRLVDNRKE